MHSLQAGLAYLRNLYLGYLRQAQPRTYFEHFRFSVYPALATRRQNLLRLLLALFLLETSSGTPQTSLG